MSDTENLESTAKPARAEDTHHDIGIVGLWFGLNYGSVLTYYALYEVVRSMGYSALMVNKPEVLWRPRYAERNTLANRFIYKYCGEENVTQCYHSSMDYKVLNQTCDTFIVGSDVVWHHQICGREAGQFFFLDFVSDEKKKIAMASSFGSGYEGPEEDRLWSEHFMKKFDYIGVREDEAVNICKNTFHCSADKIMDPVFLCDMRVYHDLAANSTAKTDERYISSYFLGPGKEKARLFLRIAELLDCKYYCLPNPNNPENFTNKTGLPALQDQSVEDWLKYFENTQCYVGDSFHGLCFSLIFGRPFVCIVNKGQSLARFRTLLATVGLENRMINLDEEDLSPEVMDKRIKDILDQKIDYDKVWEILDKNAKLSYDWLKNAIASEKDIAEATKKVTKYIRSSKMEGLYPDTVAGVPENVCTGCSACANVCPVDAITMQENEYGFIMPMVNADKCVNCKKCINTCPAVNTNADNSLQPEIYSAMAQNEIREKSSSGGMFTAAAEKIIEMGGCVCGAVFDAGKQEILHKIAFTKDELAPMRKAKYAQSNIHHIYREIKKLLDTEKPVLFTGTPCQAAALKAYLGKDYDNLYVIDILCHGVPSQKMLKGYLDEISRLPSIMTDDEPPKPVNIIFRDKERHGWRSSTFIRIEFDNGSVYEGNLKDNDPFERAFHDKTALRKACEDCPFCTFPRQGDLSIGDFWGIQELEPGMTDKLGTSIVFVNNSQGRQLYDSIKRRLAKRKLMKLQTGEIKKNRVRSHYPASPNRTRFMELLKHHTLSKSVEMLDTKHFDTGLAVNFYAVNFGGAMTHYALYHVLEDLGYATLMIERPKTAKNIDRVLESYDKIHLAPLFPEYAVAKTLRDRDEMRAVLNNKCDMFVVGSDKLFNFNLYTALDKYTSLDWVSDTKKKIAYSASFGRTLGNPKIHSELAFYLQRFDHFSAREDSGVVTAKEVYGVDNVEWVLDPVFLCDMKHYQALIDRCDRKLPEKYVSSYILDPDDDKTAILRHFMDKLGTGCEVFSEYQRPDSYYEPLGELYKGPLKTEERLQSIAGCDFFVTDSFHGMCFAILMKKPFVAIVNQKRGAARFYSIAKMLHLEDRLINDISDLEKGAYDKPIDYDAVYQVLEAERARCIKWLKNALAAPKPAYMSEYDILRELVAEQEKKISNLKELIINMTMNVTEMTDSMFSGSAETSAPAESTPAPSSSSESLADKDDIYSYITALKKNMKGNIIAIAVKDTPGLAVTPALSDELRTLGIKTDLRGQHGHGYAAVINGGKVIFEKLGAKDTPVVYDNSFGSSSVFITSRTYNSGNEAIIQINGKNHSVNSRGLNIVVYNKAEKKLVDSVCFDTHDASFACKR